MPRVAGQITGFPGSTFPIVDGSRLGDVVTNVAELSGTVTVTRRDATAVEAQTTFALGGGGASDAANVSSDIANYGRNLEDTDTNVQLVIDRLSGLVLGDIHIAGSYADLPAPSIDFEDQAWYVKSSLRLFVCDGYTVFGVLPIGAFQDVDFGTAFRIYTVTPPASLFAIGTRIYGIDQGHFLSRAGPVTAPFWAQIPADLLLDPLRADMALAVGFIGDFDDDGAALNAVSYAATSEFFYIRRGDRTLRRLTSFIAGSSGTSDYEWLLVADLRANITAEERALLNELAGRTGVHQNLTFVEAGSVSEGQFLTVGSPSGFIADLVEWDEELWVVTYDRRASTLGGTPVQLHTSSEFDNGVARNLTYWFATDGDEIRSIQVSNQADVQQHTWRTTGRADYVAMRLTVDPEDPDVLWQMVRTAETDQSGTASLRIIVYAIATDGSLTEQDDIELTRATLNGAIPGTYDDLTNLVGGVRSYSQRPTEGVEAFGVEGDRLLVLVSNIYLTAGAANHTLLVAFSIAGAPGARTLTGVPLETGVLADYFGISGFVFRELDDDFYISFDQEVKHFVPKGAAYNAPGDSHIYRANLAVANNRLEGTASPTFPNTLFDDSLLIVATPGDISGLPEEIVLRIDGVNYDWLSPHGVAVTKVLLSPSTTYLLLWNGTGWVGSHDYSVERLSGCVHGCRRGSKHRSQSQPKPGRRYLPCRESGGAD